MVSVIKNLFRQLIRKSTYIRHEPVNKVSIIILIVIDIFVLFNVFSGLSSIAQWPLSPQEKFPCFTAYENYQTSKRKGTFEFNAATIEGVVNVYNLSPNSIPNQATSRLGTASALCQDTTRLAKEINADQSIVSLKRSLDKDRDAIALLNQDIQTLQRQYDSTLLEKIAGQVPQKSINKVPAEEIKASIDANKLKISDRKKQILEKQTKLIRQPIPKAYLEQLNNISKYKNLKSAYQSAQFWYPNQQLGLQVLFLLPLIILAYLLHRSATRNNKDLLALLTWHLLLIFCLPLLIKLFEFLQFGNLVGVVIEGLTTLLGGLLFIASYALILVIPLVGFGLIKFLQRFVFNPRVQARNRIQKVHCINCNFKLVAGDEFCPSCGFNQFVSCSSCDRKTYKFTNFCKHCGHPLEPMP
jgi:hypothetical protein